MIFLLNATNTLAQSPYTSLSCVVAFISLYVLRGVLSNNNDPACACTVYPLNNLSTLTSGLSVAGMHSDTISKFYHSHKTFASIQHIILYYQTSCLFIYCSTIQWRTYSNLGYLELFILSGTSSAKSSCFQQPDGLSQTLILNHQRCYKSCKIIHKELHYIYSTVTWIISVRH